MRFLAGAIFGVLLVVVPILFSESLSQSIAEALNRCGILIGDGVSGGSISNFTVSSKVRASKAICVSGGKHIAFTNNRFFAP